MQDTSYFFIIFSATILITRVWLHYTRLSSPKVMGLQLHHYMYGLVLVILSLIINNLAVFAIGIGLIVDEIPLFFSSWHADHYHSMDCYRDLVASMAAVFMTRADLIKLFIKW